MVGSSGRVENPAADKIKTWVRRSGWSLEEVPPDEEVQQGWSVSFVDGGVPLLVYFRSREPSTVVVQGNARFTPAQVASLDRMRRSRDEFWLEAQSLLLVHHLEFDIDLAKGVTVMQRIYSDGLSEDRFWRDVNAVRSTVLHALTFFHQKLGDGPLAAPDIGKPN